MDKRRGELRRRSAELERRFVAVNADLTSNPVNAARPGRRIVVSRDLLSTIEQLAYQRKHSNPELLQKHVLLCEHGKMTGPVNRGESFARGMQ